MSIIDYIDLYLGSLLNMMFCVIIVKKVFGIKMIENKRKITIVLLVSSLLLAIINLFNKDVFKAIITLPVFIICIKEIFDLRIGKSITYVLITVFYLLIGEIITGVVFSVLKYEYQFTSNYILGRSFGNVAVIIFTTPFLYFKHLTKLVVNITNKINLDSKKSRIGIIIFITVVSAIVYKNAREIQDIVMLLMNVIIIISIMTIIYLLYKEQQKSKEIEENYNALFTYLEKYEKEIVEKRKIIHDYKNQLIVINGYIDDKVKLKESTRIDNSRFFNSLNDVPTSAITMGLKSILSAKRIILIATGVHKAEAIKHLFEGKEDINWPVTILNRHKNVTIFCDKEAASLLLGETTL